MLEAAAVFVPLTSVPDGAIFCGFFLRCFVSIVDATEEFQVTYFLSPLKPRDDYKREYFYNFL